MDGGVSGTNCGERERKSYLARVSGIWSGNGVGVDAPAVICMIGDVPHKGTSSSIGISSFATTWKYAFWPGAMCGREIAPALKYPLVARIQSVTGRSRLIVAPALSWTRIYGPPPCDCPGE